MKIADIENVNNMLTKLKYSSFEKSTDVTITEAEETIDVLIKLPKAKKEEAD
jgi:hypothetical protein